MLETVFRSADLPPAERLARFDECQVASPHPMRVFSGRPERFSATVRAADLAAVNVAELTLSPSAVHRTARMVRAYDPDLCAVVFPMSGTLTLTQADRAARLSDGDFAVYDSSRPLEVRIGDGARGAETKTTRLVRAEVPRALLPLTASKFTRLAGTRLPGQQGIGGLLTQFLTGLARDSASYQAGDATRLGTVVTDLLSAALAHHLDTPAQTPDDSHRAALLAGVRVFIQRHLGDPGLSPRTVADAHHISVSYLHRLFSGEGLTVAGWIRQQRLERARHDLANPALATMPVHRVAARWGYTDHATFTRAFRAAYHLPPQAYRETALAQPA